MRRTVHVGALSYCAALALVVTTAFGAAPSVASAATRPAQARA